MSEEPSLKANPMDVFQRPWYRLMLLFFAVYLTALWFVLGPSNPAYAVSVAAGTFALGPAIAIAPFMRRLPRRYFRVPAGERVLHRVVGIGAFAWLLDVSGWNRRVAEPLRRFSGKKTDLRALEDSLRRNAGAHGTCFVIHVLLALFALFTRHPWGGALWMLLPGVIVHLYPELLQRSIMLRLQPLLDRAES